jgi:hypothetical protein
VTEPEPTDESREIGRKIMNWLQDMPEVTDLHKMLISMAVVSTTDNKIEVTQEGFDAIAEWAQMLCQNLEMAVLFRRGMLVARVGEDGALEVDFSPEASAIIEKTRQSAEEE